jgi:hypothetical protein
MDLPVGLLDPTDGGIGHWRYNPLPSDIFDREEALEHAQFVVSIQYRVRASNRMGKGNWSYAVPVPVCTIIPDIKAALKNVVVPLAKPYTDNTSFAKKHLLRFSQFTIANMRNYDDMIVKPIEVGGGLGLLLGNHDDTRPNTRGTTAASLVSDLHGHPPEGSSSSGFDGNSTIATNAFADGDSIVTYDRDDDSMVGQPPLREMTEEDEEMAWLASLQQAKPKVVELKKGSH